MDKKIVSILCPTYNHEKFIAQTLEGFVTQKTTFPFEIIVHDDASTDNTSTIVKEYEVKYPGLFANIYQTENQFSKSIGSITKITFAAARGKYIALCEGDDYWTDPLKLQKQVDFLEANPDFAICFHRVKVIYDDRSKETYLSNQNQKEITTFEDLAEGNYIHTLSCVFRANLFGDLPDWFENSPVGDYPLHLLNAQHGKIKFFEDTMGVYRVHGGGTWESNSKMYRIEKMINVIELCRKTFFPQGNEQFSRQKYNMSRDLYTSITAVCYQSLEEQNYSQFKEYYSKYLKYLKFSNIKQFLFFTQKYFFSFFNSSQNQANFKVCKVSVALCTYNGAKFLSEQLESFLRQTRLPDELVVCDDRSTDETVEILESFARKSSFPVHVHVNETNLGSTKNFEKAITLCTNEITFLCDQDDVWLPHKTERMTAEFEKSPQIGLVCSNAEVVDENLRSLDKTLWNYHFDDKTLERVKKNGLAAFIVKEENILTGATTAFRTDYREFFLPIPTHIPGFIHDGWIGLIVASQAEVVFIDEPLIKYRQHSLQQIGVLSRETAVETAKIENENFKQLCDRVIKENKMYKQKMRDIEKALIEAEGKTKAEEKRFASLTELIRGEEKITEQSIEHFTRRRDLPPARHKRINTVIKELVSGRYNRFGLGFISAAKDLIRN